MFPFAKTEKNESLRRHLEPPEAFNVLDYKVNGAAAQRADFIGKRAGPQYPLNRSIGIFLLGSDQVMDNPGCVWHPL